MGQPSIDLPDARIIRKDGTPLPCHIKVRPVVPNDASRGSIVVVMDTSALKTAETESDYLASPEQARKRNRYR